MAIALRPQICDVTSIYVLQIVAGLIYLLTETVNMLSAIKAYNYNVYQHQLCQGLQNSYCTQTFLEPKDNNQIITKMMAFC